MEQPTSTSNTRYSNKAIALCGNISEGYEAVGPFDSWDDAARWTEKWSVEILDTNSNHTKRICCNEVLGR